MSVGIAGSGRGSAAAVTISGGTETGSTLTAVVAAGITASGYQWTRDGTNIAGATNATYVLVSADVGHNITCKVSVTVITGAAVLARALLAPTILLHPIIPSSPVSGVPSGYAQAINGGGTATRTRQWKLDGVAISGQTAATYTPVDGDIGHALTVTETLTNATGSVSSTSDPVTVVSAAPAPAPAPPSAPMTGSISLLGAGALYLNGAGLITFA